MIYYEVNVELSNDIYDQYMAWLTVHAQTILDLEGFVEARIMRVRQEPGSNKQTIVVVYELVSDQALENYLANQAPEMRQATANKFGDKLTITRRVLESEDLLINSKIMDEFLHNFEDCDIEDLLEMGVSQT